MNEIRFRIGADTSSLSRAFAHAQSAAAVAGSALAKKFDLKRVFLGAAAAIGIHLDKISTKIAELFTGGAQEAWKEGLAAAEQASRIIEEATMSRLSTLRQIEELEKQIARNAANENAAPRATPNTLSKFLGAAGSRLSRVPGLGFLAGMGANAGAILTGRESEAEAFNRSQKAQTERLANEQRVAALQAKRARDEERLTAARRELDRAGATDEQRITDLLSDAFEIQTKLEEAKKKGTDTTELELQMLGKIRAAKELDLKLEKEYTEEARKRFADGARELEQYRDLARTLLGAGATVSSARQSLADARHNALAFGVNEAASGERGNSADRARARQIVSLEARARSLFDSGRTITEFDPRTQRNVQVGAAGLMSRAQQIREGFGKLRTDEQRPFAQVEKALADANDHLAQIETSLKQVKVP